MNARRWAERIEHGLDAFNAGLLLLIVISLAWQVFGRYVLSHSPSWCEEVARFAMIWLTLLAGAAALRRGQHIAVTSLLAALPGRLQQALMLVRDLCILAAAALIAWTGFAFARMNAGQESPAMEISMAVPYAALVAGGVLMALQLALSRLGGTPIPLSEGEDASV